MGEREAIRQMSTGSPVMEGSLALGNILCPTLLPIKLPQSSLPPVVALLQLNKDSKEENSYRKPSRIASEGAGESGRRR